MINVLWEVSCVRVNDVWAFLISGTSAWLLLSWTRLRLTAVYLQCAMIRPYTAVTIQAPTQTRVALRQFPKTRRQESRWGPGIAQNPAHRTHTHRQREMAGPHSDHCFSPPKVSSMHFHAVGMIWCLVLSGAFKIMCYSDEWKSAKCSTCEVSPIVHLPS